MEFLRLIADGVIEPEEAVRAYHSVLSKLGVAPHRPLDVDLTDAYFDQLILNVYCGAGETDIYVDNLEIGPVKAGASPPPSPATISSCSPWAASTRAGARNSWRRWRRKQRPAICLRNRRSTISFCAR